MITISWGSTPQAFADRDRWVADLRHADVPVEALLEPAYLEGRAGLVGERAAQDVAPGIGADQQVAEDGGLDDSGDTVYLTAVDAQGNAVSWIQSLFASFGSGLLEPETGVVLHNRGALFTLQEGHPNQVAPGKRPYHTLTPTLATRDGALGFTLGTPGGDSQPQSLLQITNNLLLFGMTPQEAIEAPRFRSYSSLAVAIEDRVTPDVRHELGARGHELEVIHGWTATFGGAQMIHVDPVSGTLAAASDPRREAYGIAY
jgi:gamma-glutamyltranspeptidase/glutathione hydrolase